MYPDCPKSSVDLVPLPRCDDPKLKPFDFRSRQKIEFRSYPGDGLHAHVFEVKILRQIYALKLFRSCLNDNWVGPLMSFDENDREAMGAFYNYMDPFNCEYRAFGRLQEADREELALKCFGYLLLDEEHGACYDETIQSPRKLLVLGR